MPHDLDSGEQVTFAEAVREFSKKSKTVRGHEDAAAKARQDAEANAAAIKIQMDQASVKKAEIEKAVTTANECLASIEQANQQSQTQLEEVNGISSTAKNLKVQIEGYETQFQAFQKSLDTRNEDFERWSGNVETLYKEMDAKDKEIDSTIKRSEEMLKGATNAGLATTFNETLTELEDKLKGAQKAFYSSIFLLFLSALPLAAYLTFAALNVEEVRAPMPEGSTGSFWDRFSITFESGNYSPAMTAALILLMVPAVWLTKFSASRHHQLFLLKEHYQYKYSLAMAVDGFKKQAPDHADAIAAETFNRLLFNPADRLEAKSAQDDHPSPLMNSLMNKFGFNAKGKES